MKPLLLTLLFVSSILSTSSSYAAYVDNFKAVAKDFYRSARPSQRDLKNFKEKYKLGIILNIENNVEAIEKEESYARQLGIEHISSPMSWKERPSDEQVDEILNRLSDTSKGAILLHCKHGEDRTGMIVGLYRVLVQNWSPKDAYAEMLKTGFHPHYTALDDYFKERTGFH